MVTTLLQHAEVWTAATITIFTSASLC